MKSMEQKYFTKTLRKIINELVGDIHIKSSKLKPIKANAKNVSVNAR